LYVEKQYKNIQNYVVNTIEKNLNVDNISKCVNSVKQKQKIEFDDMEAKGNIEFTNIKQSQQIDSTTSCIMEFNVLGSLFENLNEIAQDNISSVDSNANILSESSQTTTKKLDGLDMKLTNLFSKDKESEESDEQQNKQGSTIIVIIVIIALVAGAYFLFRKKNNNKRRQKD
jgi:LPXTG-motif cell wall-anchored protein